ncbi:nitrilase-related carbon-nitrogen hydrolase [Saccharomonospora viridis]|mgnify:CR=1 FL=1|jgi:predicted amidohydrolase|uniref:Predicted amidohydrolase n=2 Tax=Saccharomonospora viridis TaxID=1852 RepID=C7MXB7_SACVD|nr:nitrilase-related carbon-nitrogen hydrolase [Saccharomonospora viridis]ACU95926.1 predicted amidohydrolase [Saccharomonospora viridis DSM 43017]KHF45579.1 amidohydrolase [Saccharomonospora viridis]SFP73614.1 Predicted amidohydrolase [Saccharomonospora viridis]
MRVALAQTDCRLGDVEGNLADAERIIKQAAEREADLVVFPELSLTGYALGRLTDNVSDISLWPDDPRLAALSRHGPDVVIGLLEDGRIRRHNSALYLSNGALVHNHRKLYLPNYLIWEERKHASPGQHMRAFDTRHGRFATLVCNDAWQPMLPWLAAQDGAELLIVPANSAAKPTGGSFDPAEYWHDLLTFTARMQQCWVVFVNRVGDEAGVRFWGGSRVLDPWGSVVTAAPDWEESLTVVDIDLRAVRKRRHEIPLLADARMGLLRRELERLITESGGD